LGGRISLKIGILPPPFSILIPKIVFGLGHEERVLFFFFYDTPDFSTDFFFGTDLISPPPAPSPSPIKGEGSDERIL